MQYCPTLFAGEKLSGGRFVCRKDVISVSVTIDNGYTDRATTYQKVWLVKNDDSFDDMVRNIGCYIEQDCSLLAGRDGYVDRDILKTYEDYEDNFGKMTALEQINMKLEKVNV
jgi:hypothetical protein